MATLDLGQFDEDVVSARSWGPPTYRRRVHVKHVTESDREESCRTCGGSIPVGGELYLLGGYVECAGCYLITKLKLRPAPGFDSEVHYGGPPRQYGRYRPRRFHVR